MPLGNQIIVGGIAALLVALPLFFSVGLPMIRRRRCKRELEAMAAGEGWRCSDGADGLPLIEGTYDGYAFCCDGAGRYAVSVRLRRPFKRWLTLEGGPPWGAAYQLTEAEQLAEQALTEFVNSWRSMLLRFEVRNHGLSCHFREGGSHSKAWGRYVRAADVVRVLPALVHLAGVLDSIGAPTRCLASLKPGDRQEAKMDTPAPMRRAPSPRSMSLLLLLLSLLVAAGCGEGQDTCNKACEYLGRCSLPSSSYLTRLKEAACGPGVGACRGSASFEVGTTEGQGRCVINALDRLALIHTPDDAETWDYVEDEDFCRSVELVLSGQVSKEHQEPFKHACEGGSSNGLTDNCTWIYDQLTGACQLTLPPKS